jgi:hypothetical protein
VHKFFDEFRHHRHDYVERELDENNLYGNKWQRHWPHFADAETRANLLRESFPPKFEEQHYFSSSSGAGGAATQRSRNGRGQKRSDVTKRRFHMGGVAAENAREIAARLCPLTRSHCQQTLVA